MKIELSRRAESELDAIASYYAKVASPDVAEHVITTLIAAFQQLSDSPRIGTPVYYRRGLRKLFLQHPPYVITYRMETGRISIVSIRHGSRQPETW